MTDKLDYRCPECGSDDVTMDATARWNADGQYWVLSDTLGPLTCQDCDDDAADFETPYGDEQEI